MEWVFWSFYFSQKRYVWSNDGKPNDQGQIYIVPQCMKRMGTKV